MLFNTVGDIRLNGVQNQDSASLNHVPLIKCQLVDYAWDEGRFWNTNGTEHRLLPEAGSALDGRKCIHEDQDNDTLDWSRDYAKCECFRVVFVPGLDVEGEQCCTLLAKVDIEEC